MRLIMPRTSCTREADKTYTVNFNPQRSSDLQIVPTVPPDSPGTYRNNGEGSKNSSAELRPQRAQHAGRAVSSSQNSLTGGAIQPFRRRITSSTKRFADGLSF
jgi:hypothetical protein